MRAVQYYESYMRRATKLVVTVDHLKLLRNMYVSWDDCEFGAPAIDCKRPYGNSDVVEDMADILGIGIPEDEGDYELLYEEMTRLHAEMALVLQIVLVTGEFETGTYLCDPYGGSWTRVD